uniref:Uncharacterized protein n=1 Tax=Rhizophora mucronata TaxID=61149 RepID=A0A2P2PI66_RHIMU
MLLYCLSVVLFLKISLYIGIKKAVE